MPTGIFAGIAVSDFDRSLGWFEQLLGREPSFLPHDREAVWELAPDRFVYIVQDRERAGGSLVMIWVDDPRAEVARLATRGIEPTEVEQHDRVVKYVYSDPDGNQIGIGGEVD